MLKSAKMRYCYFWNSNKFLTLTQAPPHLCPLNSPLSSQYLWVRHWRTDGRHTIGPPVAATHVAEQCQQTDTVDNYLLATVVAASKADRRGHPVPTQLTTDRPLYCRTFAFCSRRSMDSTEAMRSFGRSRHEPAFQFDVVSLQTDATK